MHVMTTPDPPPTYRVTGWTDDDGEPGEIQECCREFTDRIEALHYAGSLDDPQLETLWGGDAVQVEDAAEINESLAQLDR